MNDFIQINDATLAKEVTRDDTVLQILKEWNGKSGNNATPKNEEDDTMAWHLRQFVMTKQDTADHVLDNNEISQEFTKKSLTQLAIQKKIFSWSHHCKFVYFSIFFKVCYCHSEIL